MAGSLKKQVDKWQNKLEKKIENRSKVKVEEQVSPIHLQLGDMFISKFKDELDSLLCFEFKGIVDETFVFYCTDHNSGLDDIYKNAKKVKCKYRILKSRDDYYLIAIYLPFNEITKFLTKIEIEKIDQNVDSISDMFD